MPDRADIARLPPSRCSRPQARYFCYVPAGVTAPRLIFRRFPGDIGNRSPDALQTNRYGEEYPKLISDVETQRTLIRSGVVRPRIRDFYPKVIRFLLENNWEAMPQAQASLSIRA